MRNGSVTDLILAALLSGLLSFCLTSPTRFLAKRIGAMDIPRDERRMHTKPIPRLGGLAIFLSFIIVLPFFLPLTQKILALILSASVIVTMGVVDDVFSLSPKVKLFIQFCVAVGITLQGYLLFPSLFLIGRAVTVLWIVSVTNAMNLIDGLDGLCSGIGAMVALSLGAILFFSGDTASALLCAVLFGSLIGFLPFNIYRARIFLGDTGSQLVGFLLAVLSISSAPSLPLPLLLLSLPLLDTALAFFRRLLCRRNPFSPDRSHLHHRLIDFGYSHPCAVLTLHGVCASTSLASLCLATENRLGAFSSLSLALLLFLSARITLPAPNRSDSIDKSTKT